MQRAVGGMRRCDRSRARLVGALGRGGHGRRRGRRGARERHLDDGRRTRSRADLDEPGAARGTRVARPGVNAPDPSGSDPPRISQRPRRRLPATVPRLRSATTALPYDDHARHQEAEPARQEHTRGRFPGHDQEADRSRHHLRGVDNVWGVDREGHRAGNGDRAADKDSNASAVRPPAPASGTRPPTDPQVPAAAPSPDPPRPDGAAAQDRLAARRDAQAVSTAAATPRPRSSRTSRSGATRLECAPVVGRARVRGRGSHVRTHPVTLAELRPATPGPVVSRNPTLAPPILAAPAASPAEPTPAPMRECIAARRPRPARASSISLRLRRSHHPSAVRSPWPVARPRRAAGHPRPCGPRSSSASSSTRRVTCAAAAATAPRRSRRRSVSAAAARLALTWGFPTAGAVRPVQCIAATEGDTMTYPLPGAEAAQREGNLRSPPPEAASGADAPGVSAAIAGPRIGLRDGEAMIGYASAPTDLDGAGLATSVRAIEHACRAPVGACSTCCTIARTAARRDDPACSRRSSGSRTERRADSWSATPGSLASRSSTSRH